jgi:hypothetical protein
MPRIVAERKARSPRAAPHTLSSVIEQPAIVLIGDLIVPTSIVRAGPGGVQVDALVLVEDGESGFLLLEGLAVAVPVRVTRSRCQTARHHAGMTLAFEARDELVLQRAIQSLLRRLGRFQRRPK